MSTTLEESNNSNNPDLIPSKVNVINYVSQLLR